MGRPVTTVSLIVAVLMGCGGVQKKEALSVESTLTAAGFQKRPADTPEKLAQLQKLPQRKILTQKHEGNPLYLYADAEDCKCLYAGSENAYKKFQSMVAEGDEANELAQAKALQPASTDPDWVDVPSFGEWQPWY